jgi:hypothetical protein
MRLVMIISLILFCGSLSKPNKSEVTDTWTNLTIKRNQNIMALSNHDFAGMHMQIS